MNKNLLFYCLIICLFLCNKSWAQKRSFDVAKRIAKEQLMSFGGNLVEVDVTEMNYGPKKSRSRSVKDNKPFYIFNDLDNPSFVIVSGDERMRTILGSSDDSVFNPDSLPCGLICLLSHYTEQYASLNDIGLEAISMLDAPIYNSPSSDIGPLLSTEWDQSYSPYNDNCPSGCPAGCVATAMGQIMFYYKYPATGDGDFSYISRSQNYQRSYNFSNAFFDWTSMQNSYDEYGNASSISRRAVANLLEACGVSVGMDYTTDGSGAFSFDVPYALIHFFKYNPNVANYERDYFKSSDWYEKIFEELVEGRPVLYSGVDRTGDQPSGHAFVIDGYKKSDGKFHVNWGWSGRYNGFYELDALDPSIYRFSTGQSMVVKFCPESIGSSDDTFYAEEFTHDGDICIDREMNFLLKGVYNFSNSSSYVVESSSFSGLVGVGLYDSNKEFIQSLTEEKIRLKTAYGYERFPFQFIVPSSIMVNNKTYYITPYAKANSSDVPTPIRTINGKTDYYSISIDGEEEPSNDDPKQIENLLKEDFESGNISSEWSQINEMGSGNWQGTMVMLGNDNSRTPYAASGNSYAYLDYNSGTIFADIRTVTKLITPELSGVEGMEYVLNFQCRKYASRVGTTDIISIMIDRGCNGQWELISDYSIANKNTWMGINSLFSVVGRYRLAIEGSIEYGSTLFVDDINVARVEGKTIISSVETDNNTEEAMYSLSGQRTIDLGRGIYIIRQKNGKTKKIIH